MIEVTKKAKVVIISASVLIFASILTAFQMKETSVNLTVKHYEEKIVVLENKDSFTIEKAAQHLINMNVAYPDIVLAQCMVESAWKSKIFKENNNCLGMKMPYKRPTLAIGENRGHAVYKSWRDCLTDYAIWQVYCCKTLNREEYIQFLEKNYAESPIYIESIKSYTDYYDKLIQKLRK